MEIHIVKHRMELQMSFKVARRAESCGLDLKGNTSSGIQCYPIRNAMIHHPECNDTPSGMQLYPIRNTMVSDPEYIDTPSGYNDNPSEIQLYPIRNAMIPHPEYNDISHLLVKHTPAGDSLVFIFP